MNNILKTTVIAGFAAMLGSATLVAQDAAASKDSSCCPISIEKLSASLSFGVEGVHAFRGKAVTMDSIQASFDLGYAVTDALGIYAGVWNNAPLSGANDWNETDISFGATYAFQGFVFDAGYTFYWFNNNSTRPANSHEIKAGVSYDTSALLGKYLGGATLVPSLYYYYDFDHMANYLEVAISGSLPVSKWAFDKDFLSVEASIFYGFVNSERNPGVSSRSTNGYNYVGATADLVWKINDIFSVRGGVRWVANDDQNKYGSNQNGHSDNQVWGGISTVIGF